jgi:hypothetical protein
MTTTTTTYGPLDANTPVELLYDLPFKAITIPKGTRGRLLRSPLPYVYVVAFDMPSRLPGGKAWVYRAEVGRHEIAAVQP